MKKFLIGLLVGILAGVGGKMILSPSHAPAAEPATAATHPNEDGAKPLHYSAEDRQKVGIATAVPERAPLNAEIVAVGRVLDPTPLLVLAAELEAAKTALEAAEKDVARSRSLLEQGGNASLKAVETAAAAAATARVQVASAKSRLLATWGKELAVRVENGSLNDALGKGEGLIRIDFSDGEVPTNPSSVRVGLGSGSHELADAEVLGPAAAVDPQMQTPGLFALVKSGHWPVGAGLQAVIGMPGDGTAATFVPREAVVYHEGSSWVYVLGEHDIFERRRVELGRAVGKKYVVTDGVQAEDQVAVTGAQRLLSSELQAGAGG
jgi:hypothetical protein